MTPSQSTHGPVRLIPARSWRLTGVLVAVAASLLGVLLVTQPERSEASIADLNPSPVDGERAYGYLKQICALGPRVAGTESNTRQRKMVADHFKKLGGEIREQKFRVRHPLTNKPVEMVNLIGSWFPDRKERVVFGAHYDTRPFPDMEPDPARRRDPFLGANDGASGVALLMEMANHLSESPTPWGVDLVLFDGEELIYEDDQGNRSGEFFLGSMEFARQYKADRKKSDNRYVAGIVLDMVGDRDLAIPVELTSHRRAVSLVRDVWGVASKLQSTVFKQELGREVLDDHIPLNDAGIPTIDIIDFDYPYWHTADDTPAQCSGKSLGEVGRVVTAWVNQPKASKSKKRN